MVPVSCHPIDGRTNFVGRESQDELIDECERLTAERRQIAAVLADLPSTVGELRTALNRLHTIVG